jgi:hypothetical protein
LSKKSVTHCSIPAASYTRRDATVPSACQAADPECLDANELEVLRSRKQARYTDQDARNKELGTAGEKLVVAVEVENLRSTGRQDLADQVVHVARVEGDAAGYDVRSYSLEGEVRHIEVNTTRGPVSRVFFVSANEIEFNRQHPDTYHFYWLYGFDDDLDSARYYVERGALTEEFALEPT